VSVDIVGRPRLANPGLCAVVHNNSLVLLVAEALTSVEASTRFRRRIEAKFATEIHAVVHSLASP
jgi:hypothetical protein